MFDSKWRMRCEMLEQQVSRLEQDNQSMTIELNELRGLQAQTQQEQDRAVAGAECNTVIELKQAQHDAFPPLLS